MDHFLTRLAAVLAAGVLAGCQANPGPPPVVEAESPTVTSASPTTTTPDEAEQEEALPERSTVAIGVDPLRGGLNPHIMANNSELVSQIAELVLPSAFHDDEMDADVLESAEEIDAPGSVAMRVRYTIAAPAQWSDGTPISGSDFTYLWEQMNQTAGVNNAAGYRAISAVRTSGNGRVVTVDDPWGFGNSLEWATSCPPPRHNFTELPRIRSERPAFELHYPEYVERFRNEAHVGGRSGHSRVAPSELAAHTVQHDVQEDPRER